MGSDRKPHREERNKRVRSLPLPADRWALLVKSLQLAPRHVQIVELILRGMQDKEIAATLDLEVCTVHSTSAGFSSGLGFRIACSWSCGYLPPHTRSHGRTSRRKSNDIIIDDSEDDGFRQNCESVKLDLSK